MTFEEAKALLKKRSLGSKKGNFLLLKQTAKKLGVLPVYKTALIAGTNGKGTTAFLLAKTAEKSGLKTGLFTSPHLFDIRERICINGKKISKKDLCSCLEKVLSAEIKPLNFFELLTLSALVYFKQKKVNFAVFECGIGGLKDSTNIINADISIITSVAKDHEKLLGRTIKKITAQKAGIIKSKKPCIIGQVPAEALKVIKTVCRQKKSVLFRPAVKNIKFDFKKNQTNLNFNDMRCFE